MLRSSSLTRCSPPRRSRGPTSGRRSPRRSSPAGTAVNTVPAEASARVDVRVRTESEAGRISAALAALEPVDPGTSVDVERSISIPPLERGASVDALRAGAGARRRSSAWPTLAEAAVGGGSDGNVLAGLGLQVLDGLGAVGDHAHAEGEYVEVEALAERAALVAALVQDLLG